MTRRNDRGERQPLMPGFAIYEVAKRLGLGQQIDDSLDHKRFQSRRALCKTCHCRSRDVANRSETCEGKTGGRLALG